MQDRHGGQRLFGTTEELARQTERTREITKQAVELLRQPVPDTFLGRKTQEPFPREEQGPMPKPQRG
ncbi:hypothetical protein [Bradyrhizobium sp. STM 3562]|uniref:hypothetical protein n=1 Tax=Bradyrhizobium sp. STM 3562 TaxID=578924 RepID=UPI00388DC669